MSGPPTAPGGPALAEPDRAALLAVLARARDLGFLGPGELEPHVTHAMGFALALGEAPRRVADLGSGAGVPGLALALWWPDLELVLVEAGARRVEHLTTAVEELHLGPRVRVVHERAELVGRDPDHRGRFDAVVARSFAAPAVTAECAAPLLVLGGVLVTSEPPGDDDRWAGLRGVAGLGLSAEGGVQGSGRHYHRCRKVGATDERYPRRVGVPAKRPLF